MRRVVVESPLAGDLETNKAYARACARDCYHRGEAPYASHLFFDQPGLLDDTIPEEREFGIEAGLAWGQCAELTVVYIDRGVSNGMRRGIERAKQEDRPIEYRSLYGKVKQEEWA